MSLYLHITFINLIFNSFYAKITYGGKIMEIKTRQIEDKPLTVIIEYPILDTKTQNQEIQSFESVFGFSLKTFAHCDIHAAESFS